MTRIRYSKDDEGYLVSKPIFSIDNEYYVSISEKNLTATIMTKHTEIVGFKSKDLHSLKLWGKNWFKDRGVRFDEEIRNRKRVIQNEPS